MPKIKSAIKRVEVAERNRQRNKAWKSSVRTVRNRVEEACKDADTKLASANLRTAYAIIDRAVAKGVLHRNSAARKKSTLARMLLTAAPAPAKRKTKQN